MSEEQSLTVSQTQKSSLNRQLHKWRIKSRNKQTNQKSSLITLHPQAWRALFFLCFFRPIKISSSYVSYPPRYRCSWPCYEWELGRRSTPPSPSPAPTSSIWSWRYFRSSSARWLSPCSVAAGLPAPPRAPRQPPPLLPATSFLRRRRNRAAATATQSSGRQRSSSGRATGTRHSASSSDRHVAGAVRAAVAVSMRPPAADS
ncbi:unnamed protein product [Urochloa humidicola]